MKNTKMTTGNPKGGGRTTTLLNLLYFALNVVLFDLLEKSYNVELNFTSSFEKAERQHHSKEADEGSITQTEEQEKSSTTAPIRGHHPRGKPAPQKDGIATPKAGPPKWTLERRRAPPPKEERRPPLHPTSTESKSGLELCSFFHTLSILKLA